MPKILFSSPESWDFTGFKKAQNKADKINNLFMDSLIFCEIKRLCNLKNV